MAKDIPKHVDVHASISEPLPIAEDWTPIDEYLATYEEEERRRCRAVNLALLNEPVEGSDDDDGDVPDEYEDQAE